MKVRKAKTLKPGFYSAKIWPENKDPSFLMASPHPWFEPGCRVEMACQGKIRIHDWLTLMNPDHKLYEVRRLK